MRQLSFDFGPSIPRICDVCGIRGRFKRPVCSTCYWNEIKTCKPSTPEQREKWRERARARYARARQEARA